VNGLAGAVCEDHSEQADGLLGGVWVRGVRFSRSSREDSASLQWHSNAQHGAAFPAELGLFRDRGEAAGGGTGALYFCGGFGSGCDGLHATGDVPHSVSICEGCEGCDGCQHRSIEGVWVREVWGRDGKESGYERDERNLLFEPADANQRSHPEEVSGACTTESERCARVFSCHSLNGFVHIAFLNLFVQARSVAGLLAGCT
jgi:hypothetical protein